MLCVSTSFVISRESHHFVRWSSFFFTLSSVVVSRSTPPHFSPFQNGLLYFHMINVWWTKLHRRLQEEPFGGGESETTSPTRTIVQTHYRNRGPVPNSLGRNLSTGFLLEDLLTLTLYQNVTLFVCREVFILFNFCQTCTQFTFPHPSHFLLVFLIES